MNNRTQLVFDALLNRKPVAIAQQRGHVITSRSRELGNNSELFEPLYIFVIVKGRKFEFGAPTEYNIY